MKKIFSVVGIIVVFFIIYFLQVNFFSWFNIAGIKPNLFVILVLFIGLFINNKLASILGFLFGIYLDILTSNQVGVGAIIFAIMGYICIFLDKAFSKESKITLMLIIAGGTFLYELIDYIYTVVSNHISIQLLGFFKIVAIECVFNVLLVIILYPLIRKMGIVFERIFKKSSGGAGYILSN